MATATTLTSWDAALKQYYRSAAVDDLVYKSHPLFEILPKDQKFEVVFHMAHSLGALSETDRELLC